MTSTMSTVEHSETDMKGKGKEKEILVVQDEGVFVHDTGDTYDGYFEAKKKDRVAKMHGHGEYTTEEGDVYSGMWDNDRFGVNDEITITYADGSRYVGQFSDWSYHKHGKYHNPDDSFLECDFQENCPVGKLQLTDPNGHLWLGKASQGYGWVSPVNHYLNMLEKTRRVLSKAGIKYSDTTKKTK